jgi:hypothetical protein
MTLDMEGVPDQGGIRRGGHTGMSDWVGHTEGRDKGGWLALAIRDMGWGSCRMSDRACR